MRRSLDGERDYVFGGQMVTLRSNLGLTQEGLAQSLGVSRRAVADWEVGNAYPKVGHLKALIELGVRASAFTTGREEAEIRALWKAARQKVLLDEAWMAELLASPTPTRITPQVGTATVPAAKREAAAPRFNLVETPDVSHYTGRGVEVARLSRWILEERCRLVALLGMGGIGKSTLASYLAHSLAHHFEAVLWRSVRDAPECSDLVADCLAFFSETPPSSLPASLEQRIILLVECLQERRCLLVIDNLESLLQSGNQAGNYLPGYEGYGRLIARLGEAAHQSCVLLTSREKPAALRLLEVRLAQVRSMHLSGLEEAASEQLLTYHELLGSPQERTRLIDFYEGNPLALNIVSETIVDLFSGHIAPFLAQQTLVFGSISDLLAEQWDRLSASEQTLLYWLAAVREPVTIVELHALLVAQLASTQMYEALDALHRRSLVERGHRSGSFTLHSVVLEYAATRLLEEMAREIEAGQPALLLEQGLELATAKDYVRQTQTRLLVAPLLEHLRGRYQAREELERRLLALLFQLRNRSQEAQGYGPATLLALLREERGHLRGLDLSRLSIRGANLQGIQMQDTSLAGANLRDTFFTEAFDAPWSVAVSPNGGYIAAGSNSGQVRIWREEGWVTHLSMRGHTNRAAIAFSTDGLALVTASWDGAIRLWEVESGAALWTGRNQHVAVTSLAMSPNGKLASGRFDGAIHVWDVHTGAPLSCLQTQGEAVMALAWSSDGNVLASGGYDAAIRLWDAQDGTLLRELHGHRDPVFTLAFAPDVSLLASGSSDQKIKLWDMTTGACRTTLEGHSGIVLGLAWAPGGQSLASASYDTTIRLWDTKNEQCRIILQGHRDAVTSVAFMPNGAHVLSGSLDCTLRKWDVQSGQQVRTIHSYALALSALCWSPDGRLLVSGSSESTLTLWNVHSRTPVQVLRGHRQQVNAVAWSRTTNRIASGSEDHTVRTWDAQTGACTHILRGHTDLVTAVDWRGGRWLTSGSYDHSVRLWEIQEGTSRVGIEHTGQVSAVVCSPDGTLIASASEDGLILVWRATDSELLWRFEHAGTVGALCWSPNGEQLVSGGATKGATGVVCLWDLRQGSLVRTLEGHSGNIFGIDWSAEHNILVSAGQDGTVRWWDPQLGAHLATVQAHGAWVHDVRVSPDGKTVASCGEDGIIQLWDMPSHRHLATLRTDRPYERLDISHISGLTKAQRAELRTLGATGVEHPSLL